MHATEREKRIYGSTVDIITRQDDNTTYLIKDKTGSSVMTSFVIFPGIELIYNDVHMQRVTVDSEPITSMFEINHCREGRIEFETRKGEYLYLTKGDLAINTKFGIGNSSYFPLSHYHGITIAVDLNHTPECLSCILEDVSVNLPELEKKLCGNRDILVIKENLSFEHIFSELYEVPERIRKGYYKIKVLELLLFLSGMDLEDMIQKRKYYSKKQVEAVKQIKRYLIEHLSERITLDQLSKKFGISLTIMKLCFKEVYGDSIYSYIKAYKMQQAAELLKNSELGICEIAGNVGYDNASKFSEAFKQVMNVSPSKYRMN